MGFELAACGRSIIGYDAICIMRPESGAGAGVSDPRQQSIHTGSLYLVYTFWQGALSRWMPLMFFGGVLRADAAQGEQRDNQAAYGNNRDNMSDGTEHQHQPDRKEHADYYELLVHTSERHPAFIAFPCT